jgi:hypothetical protein
MIHLLTARLRLGRADACVLAPMPFAWAKAGGVPQFGGEVAIAGDAAFIHLDVAALAFPLPP